MVGTPEYLAPEIIQNKGYGKSVDWWTLGCLIYELLTGTPPFFREEGRSELFSQIQNTDAPLNKNWTEMCKDLITNLLQKDPALRLGSGGADEVKDHPWFMSIDWEVLKAKHYKPPFIPEIKQEDSVQYFDKYFL